MIADGDIRRDATLSLAALRMLRTNGDEETVKLQRYILGLALTAFTYTSTGYLCAGCNLVMNPDKPREFVEVHGNGKRETCELTHEDALAFAEQASEDFGVGDNQAVNFDKKLASADVKGK